MSATPADPHRWDGVIDVRIPLIAGITASVVAIVAPATVRWLVGSAGLSLLGLAWFAIPVISSLGDTYSGPVFVQSQIVWQAHFGEPLFIEGLVAIVVSTACLLVAGVSAVWILRRTSKDLSSCDAHERVVGQPAVWLTFTGHVLLVSALVGFLTLTIVNDIMTRELGSVGLAGVAVAAGSCFVMALWVRRASLLWLAVTAGAAGVGMFAVPIKHWVDHPHHGWPFLDNDLAVEAVAAVAIAGPLLMAAVVLMVASHRRGAAGMSTEPAQ